MTQRLCRVHPISRVGRELVQTYGDVWEFFVIGDSQAQLVSKCGMYQKLFNLGSDKDLSLLGVINVDQ